MLCQERIKKTLCNAQSADLQGVAIFDNESHKPQRSPDAVDRLRTSGMRRTSVHEHRKNENVQVGYASKIDRYLEKRKTGSLGASKLPA
jgi:hypothetical protein